MNLCVDIMKMSAWDKGILGAYVVIILLNK